MSCGDLLVYKLGSINDHLNLLNSFKGNHSDKRDARSFRKEFKIMLLKIQLVSNWSELPSCSWVN